VAELRTGTAAAPVIVTPPRPRSQSDVVQPRPLASGAEVSSGQLTIRDRAAVDGLAAALYLARAPWRAPVIVPVPSDGVVKLPPEVHDAGPLRVLLGVEDPWTVTNWPDWPGRDSFGCAAPGIPASADTEEDALSRFLAGQRDLPVRPRRVDRLWRLLYLAGDLIAAGAPADLRERCSAVLGRQPGLALTGLLDSGLDSAACLVGLIRTGLATARPVMMDDLRAAERLWDTVPAAAAVLCTRLLAGPAHPDEDPAAVVVEAALARCGPTLDALLRGDDDPCVQVFSADLFERDDLFEGADLLEAKWPAAVVVPQPLLDAATRAVAARQLFDAWSTPELTSAAQDATSVVRSAERLVAATPYRRAAAQIAARRLALPAMSASLALVARIAARGDEACRSFERTWRGRWTGLAQRAPDLTGIDLVLAEAHIAAAERARFAQLTGLPRTSHRALPSPAGPCARPHGSSVRSRIRCPGHDRRAGRPMPGAVPHGAAAIRRHSQWSQPTRGTTAPGDIRRRIHAPPAEAGHPPPGRGTPGARTHQDARHPGGLRLGRAGS